MLVERGATGGPDGPGCDGGNGIGGPEGGILTGGPLGGGGEHDDGGEADDGQQIWDWIECEMTVLPGDGGNTVDSISHKPQYRPRHDDKKPISTFEMRTGISFLRSHVSRQE